ncbi:MAG: FRG domain-containing protein [Thermoanaerobaculia bacterium]
MGFTDTISEIRNLDAKCRANGSVAWYRGHKIDTFDLKSTLHRHVDRFIGPIKVPLAPEAKRDVLRNEYKTLYRRFKADAWPLLSDIERSDWGVIFSMQHNGLPTRLLDWSENMAAGIFFAQFGRDRTTDAALWVLDPQVLNQASIGVDGLVALDEDMSSATVNATSWHPKWTAPVADLPSIAVASIFTNARMTAQRSAFTLQGDTFAPLDQECPSLVTDGHLQRFVLPANEFDDVEDFLAAVGFTPFTVYPDLQGLALRHVADTERRLRDAKRWYPSFYD